jgi:hypothetical protein
MRERSKYLQQEQQWQAESGQGLQETTLLVHQGLQAEARRHGHGRIPQGYGGEEDSRLRQGQT